MVSTSITETFFHSSPFCEDKEMAILGTCFAALLVEVRCCKVSFLLSFVNINSTKGWSWIYWSFLKYVNVPGTPKKKRLMLPLHALPTGHQQQGDQDYGRRGGGEDIERKGVNQKCSMNPFVCYFAISPGKFIVLHWQHKETLQPWSWNVLNNSTTFQGNSSIGSIVVHRCQELVRKLRGFADEAAVKVKGGNFGAAA